MNMITPLKPSPTGSIDELNAMSDRIETATERLRTIVEARSAARSGADNGAQTRVQRWEIMDRIDGHLAQARASITRADAHLDGRRHLHVVPDLDD